MPTTTGVATDFIQFTRASNATVTDSDGKVKWAPHNLLLASESFDAASWAKLNATISANVAATTAPNGTSTADRVLAQGGNTVKYVSSTISSPTGTNTFAVFAKKDTQDFIQFLNSGDADAFVNFNISTGAVGTAGAKTTGVITPIGSGWYLCSATFANTTTYGTDFRVYLAQSASATYAAGLNAVGTEAIYLWGAHLYRSDLGGMQPNTSSFPMYNPTTPKNLLGFTESFGNAVWIKPAGTTTINPNQATAPDGTMTADLVTATAGSACHYVYQANSASVSITATIFAKAGTASWLGLGSGYTNGNETAWFDLSTGTRGAVAAGGTSTMTDAGNGWWRCSHTRSSWTGGSILAFIANANNAATFNAAGTETIYIWGAQLSDSASLDSYSPVYGAAVTSAAYYGPRRDFDPVTLACKGLLVEEQRSNLVLHSSAFDNAAWTVTGTTIASSAVTAPDGTVSADDWKIDNGIAITTSALGLYTSGITARLATSATISLSAIPYTCSLYVKLGSGISHIQLRVGTALDLTGTSYGVIVKLSDGTVSNGTAAVTPAGNGWFRIAFTFTPTAATHYVGVWAWNDTSKTANGTEFVSFYGAQLEAGSFATSYIPVGATTAGATRLADVASVSTQAFPYSATEGTIVVASTTTVNNSLGLSLNLTDGSSRISTASELSYQFNVTGSATLDGGTPSYTGDVNRVAGAYKVNDFALSFNGGTVATDTSGTVPSGMTTMFIGTLSSNSFVHNGHIRQITYLPRRVSNAELVTRSA